MPNCPVCGSNCFEGTNVCFSCGAPLFGGTPSLALSPGSFLKNGIYTVGRILGQGGFGITYLGSITAVYKPVAIKEFFPQGCVRQGTAVHNTGTITKESFDGFKNRFRREGEILRKFEHDSIVKVIDIVEENNTAYIVMEYLKGQTLLRMLQDRRGPIPEGEVLQYAFRIGNALDAIHKAQLIHRDIKPDNVIVTEDGRVVLIDFGSTRNFTASAMGRTSALIADGYSPLEQYSSKIEFAPTMDIYAMGATLYHLLTNEKPEAAPNRIHDDNLKPPNVVVPLISKRTSDAVMRALANDPKARFQTAQEFISALQGTTVAVSQPTAVVSTTSNVSSSPSAPIQKLKKALPFFLIILALVALALVIGNQGCPKHEDPPPNDPVSAGQTDIPIKPMPSESISGTTVRNDLEIESINPPASNYTFKLSKTTCSVTVTGSKDQIDKFEGEKPDIKPYVDLQNKKETIDNAPLKISDDMAAKYPDLMFTFDPTGIKVTIKKKPVPDPDPHPPPPPNPSTQPPPPN